MIKQTLCSVLALSLTGCAVFSSIDSRTDYPTPSVHQEKTPLYCPNCSTGDVKDYFSLGEQNDRYQLKLSTSSKWKDNDAAVIVGLTLFIVPLPIGEETHTVSAELHDTKNGTMVKLEPVEISETMWMGWLVMPLYPIFPITDSYDIMQKAAPIFLKQSANIIYGSNSAKWECATYSCRMEKAQKDKTTTAEDALYIAENGKSVDDFMYVKGKLAKPLTTAQNCEATLSLIKNQAVSKQTQRYWALIDFFKGNCSNTKGEIGMTKEQLIDKKGIPSKGYFMNDDTEIISYSSLSYNGEYVVSTTYTLDRDIVTNVK